MHRHGSSTDQNKKKSFIVCFLVILWILSSWCLMPIYETLLWGFVPSETPTEAAVQCQYGPIYTEKERYQFLFAKTLDYACCESKYDSLYSKTVTTELIIIKRDLICERGLQVSYKMDFLYGSEPRDKMDGLIQKLQEQFPLNKTLTYWYYPTYSLLRNENYLIEYPFYIDAIDVFASIILSFLSTGCIFATPYAFYLIHQSYKQHDIVPYVYKI